MSCPWVVELHPYERLDDLQYRGRWLIQNTREFCFSLDAVLLARFAHLRSRDRLLELGTGTGVIPLLVADKVARVEAVELNPVTAALAARNAELNGLSDELQAAADTLTEPLIFGDRFPFAYMARDYGIEYYAAFAGCSADTEPSAAKMTFLIDKAKETGAKHIYHIEFSTGKVAEAIAEASGADIRLMHSCHTVSDDDLSAGESYISIMRKNILAMKG